MQFPLYISVKNPNWPLVGLWLFHFLSFLQFSWLPIIALASQGSQVLLLFGNYLISPLSFTTNMYFISSPSFLFSIFFCYSLETPSCTEYWTTALSITFSKLSSVNPTSPSFSGNWFVDCILIHPLNRELVS